MKKNLRHSSLDNTVFNTHFEFQVWVMHSKGDETIDGLFLKLVNKLQNTIWTSCGMGLLWYVLRGLLYQMYARFTNSVTEHSRWFFELL